MLQRWYDIVADSLPSVESIYLCHLKISKFITLIKVPFYLNEIAISFLVDLFFGPIKKSVQFLKVQCQALDYWAYLFYFSIVKIF